MTERAGQTLKVTLLAGPNGAGKSTLLDNLDLGATELVLADPLAQEYRKAGVRYATADYRAGQVVLKKLRDLEINPKSFLHETNLAGSGFKQRLKKLESLGFATELIFIGLRSEDLAVERVAARLRKEGHDVDEHTVRRRWAAGLRQFLGYFCDNVHAWILFDNTDAFTLVAQGGLKCTYRIHNQPIWDEYQEIFQTTLP